MTDVVITPGRERNEPRLPSCGIFLVNPSESRRAVGLSKKQQWQRHVLFHSNLYTTPAPSFFWAGPAVGAPMAVLCLEKLIALGARRVIALGWCGALAQEITIGGVVLPTGAISEEGTSAHYPLAGPAESSPRLRQTVKNFLARQGISAKQGPVWTTDAPYRERRDKVRRYGGQGILAVDMEFSALAAVAAFRQIELASVLLVSDTLWGEKWRPGFGGKAFGKKSQELVKTLFACGHDLARQPAGVIEKG